MSLLKQFFRVLTLLVIGVLMAVLSVDAADYGIGPGDCLEAEFWPDQESNSIIAVGQDGKIVLPIIGQVTAAGKTAEQLLTNILNQILRLHSRISRAVVNVTQYNYLSVTGQVIAPGRLSFEEIPNLWTIVNEENGPTEFGDLSRVTVIRGGEKAGSVEIVDVARAIAHSKSTRLRNALAAINAQPDRIPQLQAEISELERHVEDTRRCRDAFRSGEATVGLLTELAKDRTRYRIIEPALVPLQPVLPDKRRMVLIAFAPALVVGSMVVLVVELVDNSFRRLEELESYLGMAILAAIPCIEKYRIRR